MGRSFKDGIESFLLDANTDGDIKFQIVEARYGIVGFGIIVKLYQMIYRDNGYFCKWDELIAAISSSKWSCQKFPVTELDAREIVKEAIKYGFFDKDLYEKYNILTSRGIQRRYFEVAKRRIRVDAKKEYLLLSIPELPENVYINGKNVNINPENARNNSTRNGMEGMEGMEGSGKGFPTLEQIKNFCKNEKLNINGEKFFYYYSAKNWAGIEDWKSKAREWAVTEKTSENENYAAFDLDLYEKMVNSKD